MVNELIEFGGWHSESFEEELNDVIARMKENFDAFALRNLDIYLKLVFTYDAQPIQYLAHVLNILRIYPHSIIRKINFSTLDYSEGELKIEVECEEKVGPLTIKISGNEVRIYPKVLRRVPNSKEYLDGFLDTIEKVRRDLERKIEESQEKDEYKFISQMISDYQPRLAIFSQKVVEMSKAAGEVDGVFELRGKKFTLEIKNYETGWENFTNVLENMRKKLASLLSLYLEGLAADCFFYCIVCCPWLDLQIIRLEDLDEIINELAFIDSEINQVPEEEKDEYIDNLVSNNTELKQKLESLKNAMEEVDIEFLVIISSEYSEVVDEVKEIIDELLSDS